VTVVLGVDTAIANVGWAVADAGVDGLRPLAMGVIRTASSAKKRGIRVGDDDFARTCQIARELHALVERYTPAVITCEAWSPPRNAAAVGKIGRCFGVLADISVVWKIPVLHATPQDLKKALLGRNSASKEEIMAELDSRFRKCADGTPAHLLRAVPAGQREHPYDALGSILACWDDPTMLLVRKGAP